MSEHDDQTVSNAGTESEADCGCKGTSSASSDTENSTYGTHNDDQHEDGYDVLTHGGGSLEAVVDFQTNSTMVTGIGSLEAVAIPGDAATLPCASTFEHGDPPESVCGEDDRTQINAVGSLPWRMICQLVITHADGRRSRGTGWFISPRTVMTAGHCVFSRKAGGWADIIEVIPGMNGTDRPFGSAKSSNLRSVNGWIDSAKPTHDYGCIVLPTSDPLGEKTGWFGFSNLSDDSLSNLLANNSGYPGDKTFGTQWYNAGRVTEIAPKRLHYMLDTAPGPKRQPDLAVQQDHKQAPRNRYSCLRRVREQVDKDQHSGLRKHEKVEDSWPMIFAQRDTARLNGRWRGSGNR